LNRGIEKSFYVFMCGLLGVLLFVILQQSLILIHYVLLDKNFATYSAGLTITDLRAIALITLFFAVFFGMWYGIWLGLHWYGLVYEQGEAPLFHGFPVRSRPSQTLTKKPMDALPPYRPFKPVDLPPSHTTKVSVTSAAPKPAGPKPAPKLAPVAKAPAPKPAPAKIAALKPAPAKPAAAPKPAFWDFDDLLKSATESVTKPKKSSSKSVRSVAKRAARKSPRKQVSSIESV
jgi:hypothetical protein